MEYLLLSPRRNKGTQATYIRLEIQVYPNDSDLQQISWSLLADKNMLIEIVRLLRLMA